MRISVLTWNLFHARDGHPDAAPTWRSTLLRRPVEGGGHLHLNRRHAAQMADVIRRIAPDVALLQEVPTAAIGTLAARSDMAAAWAPIGPMIGPRDVRDRWGTANADLWRAHEGGANVILVGRRLRPVPGTLRRVRLNPPRTVARMLWRLRPPAREVAHWAGERRMLVAGALSTPGGPALAVGCLHCQNTYIREIVAAEVEAAAHAMDALRGGGPALLGGDFNVHPGHPALEAMAGRGWEDAGAPRGIDRILHHGLEVVEPPRALPAASHTVRTPHRGGWWPVLLSDHAPVLATYRLPGAGGA